MAEDAGHGSACDAGGSAAAKGVNPTYVSRILRLNLLAPDIVEAILDGRQAGRLDCVRRQDEDLGSGLGLIAGRPARFPSVRPLRSADKEKCPEISGHISVGCGRLRS